MGVGDGVIGGQLCWHRRRGSRRSRAPPREASDPRRGGEEDIPDLRRAASVAEAADSGMIATLRGSSRRRRERAHARRSSSPRPPLSVVISISDRALVRRRSDRLPVERGSPARFGRAVGSRDGTSSTSRRSSSGTVIVSVIAMVVATPLGPGRRRLPLRVREARRAPAAQADPRDARSRSPAS